MSAPVSPKRLLASILAALLSLTAAPLVAAEQIAPPSPAAQSLPPALTPTPAQPAPPPVHLPAWMTAPEFTMGSAKAKVTVVEYASDTCSHCARFAAEVFPDFKKKYIDTGKVLYVFREFPTDPVQLSGAGFVLARCAGQAKYFDVVNALFLAQSTSHTGLEFLTAGAKAGDLTDEQLRACLTEPAAIADLEDRVRNAVEIEKIAGTPAFIINGTKISPGEKTLVELETVIDPLLASKVAPKHRTS